MAWLVRYQGCRRARRVGTAAAQAVPGLRRVQRAAVAGAGAAQSGGDASVSGYAARGGEWAPRRRPVAAWVTEGCGFGRRLSRRPDGRRLRQNQRQSGCEEAWPAVTRRHIPLHCLQRVSNPCASGRCSSVLCAMLRSRRPSSFQTPAPRGGVPLEGKGEDAIVSTKFQTPAPRGGVPLFQQITALAAYLAGFKPLRLGAVFL